MPGKLEVFARTPHRRLNIVVLPVLGLPTSETRVTRRARAASPSACPPEPWRRRATSDGFARLGDDVARVTEYYGLTLGIVLLLFALGLRRGLLDVLLDLWHRHSTFAKVKA